MQSATEFDLLILGGGCAGLSLAMHLAESDYGGRVGIIEPRCEYQDDRSWCFWAADEHQLSGIVSCSWPRWLVSRKNGQLVHGSATGSSYHYVNSLEFYRLALSIIRSSPNISLFQGDSARRVYRLNHHLMVDTASASLRSRWLVDTRPPAPDQLAQSLLFQCFFGQVISLADDAPAAFNADAVELMTDMCNDRQGLQFSYVLPFGQRRALVEVTRFSRETISREQLREELEDLIRRRGWRSATVEREEGGVLPMGLPAMSPEPLPGFLRAGIGGGALRAASGYGFQRIQRWASRCSASLLQGGPPLAQASDSTGQAWMDKLFLQVLRDRPEQAPLLFERLFARVPGPVLLRFLSDQAGCLDNLRVITSLPRRPFLQSLLRVPSRRSARPA